MTGPETAWVWERLPTEILERSVLARNAPSSLLVDQRPFASQRIELDDELSYQLALASHSNPNAKILRSLHPDLSLSGDSRSGVLLYQNNIAVGSLIVNSSGGYSVSVLPEHRELGHAQRMFELWYKKVRIILDSTHIINAGGLGAFLAAHEGSVKSALAIDAPVPKNVWRSIETGSDADKLFSRVRKELRR